MTEPEDTPIARPALVLVVEDEVLIRMAIAEALRDAGCTVIEAGSAREAIAAAQSGIAPDVLFTDVRMPGEMDGLALAQELQRSLPRLKVLVTSAHLSEAEERFRHNFVPKPYNAAVVIKRVLAALEDEDDAE